MPILAVCPYCREGKVRAPAHAVGLSATCPRCQSCFTIVASEEPKSPKVGPAVVRTAPASMAATAKAAPSPAAVAAQQEVDPDNGTLREIDSLADTVDSSEPPPVISLPPARPMPMPVPASAQPEFSFVLGLVALIIAGVGLASSLVPAYGRIIATVLTCVGLVVGVLSLLFVERKYLAPAVGAGVNGFALLLVAGLGGWLGFGPWLPDRANVDTKIVKAVGYDGETPVPADWVDISKAAWQQGDVRVTVKASTIAPLELTSPKNQKKWTKEKYLQIWVQIKNSGVERQIDFRGWSLVEGPGAAAPVLTDSAGKRIARKSFEGEWQPGSKTEGKALLPGSTAEQLLIFALPEPKIEYLRLELPPAPFGGTEPVRLTIPRGSILYRS